jgi:hypothetical protein
MEDLKKLTEDLLKQPKKGKHSVSEDEFKKEINMLTTEFQLQFSKIEKFMECLVNGITLILEKVNSIDQQLQTLKKSPQNKATHG